MHIISTKLLYAHFVIWFKIALFFTSQVFYLILDSLFITYYYSFLLKSPILTSSLVIGNATVNAIVSLCFNKTIKQGLRDLTSKTRRSSVVQPVGRAQSLQPKQRLTTPQY